MRFFAALYFFIIGVSPHAFAYQSPVDFDGDNSPYKVLVFLSKDCPCSRSHVPHLNELSQSSKTVKFFGVISDEFTESSRSDIETYFSDTNFKFPIIKDVEQKLVKDYNALKTPHTALFKRQPNGKYTLVYEGGVTDRKDFGKSRVNFLKENLAAVADDKPLPHANGKSLGCYIRRI